MRLIAIAILSVLSIASGAAAWGPSRPEGGSTPVKGNPNSPPAVPGWFGRRGSGRGGWGGGGSMEGGVPHHSTTGLDGLDHGTVDMPPDDEADDYEEVAQARNVIDPEKDHYHDRDMHSYGSHCFSCKEY